MGRSSWKSFFIHKSLLKIKNLNLKQLNVRRKSSILIPAFVDKRFFVYCGKLFKRVYCNRYRFFFRIGEFCHTRAKYMHKNKLKVIKQKKQKTLKNVKK